MASKSFAMSFQYFAICSVSSVFVVVPFIKVKILGRIGESAFAEAGNTTQQIPSVKIDQDFGPSTKASFFWDRQDTNQIAAPDGLPIPLTSSRPKLVDRKSTRL